MVRCQRVLGAAVALAAAGLGLVAVAGPAHAASLRVSPTANLSPGGQSVTVSGSGFDPARNNGFGVYVVFGPRRSGFHRDANAFASAFWVHRNGGGGGQVKMTAAGAFSLSLSVKARFTDGNGRSVNCATTSCYVMAFAAHGVSDRSQDVFVPISFRGSGSGSGSGGGSGGGSAGGGTGGAAGPGSGGAAGASGSAPSSSAAGTATTAPGAGGPPGAAPAGSATPLAVEPFRETAAGPPARSPWPFWAAVGAVVIAAAAVRAYTRRLRRR
ncbi:hypothetical protein OHR68_13360 [Spirillospora sp. NBC_00431]